MLNLAIGAALVLVAFGVLPVIMLPARRYPALLASGMLISWTLLFLWACWILAGALSAVLDRLANA